MTLRELQCQCEALNSGDANMVAGARGYGANSRLITARARRGGVAERGGKSRNFPGGAQYRGRGSGKRASVCISRLVWRSSRRAASRRRRRREPSSPHPDVQRSSRRPQEQSKQDQVVFEAFRSFFALSPVSPRFPVPREFPSARARQQPGNGNSAQVTR